MASDEQARALAEAEEWLSRIAAGYRPPLELSAGHAEAILDEYDRRGEAMSVLRELVEFYKSPIGCRGRMPGFQAAWERAVELVDGLGEGPRQIAHAPEPPRDRVIEARDADGEVKARWTATPDSYGWVDAVHGGFGNRWFDLLFQAMDLGWSLWSVPAEGGDQ